MCHFKTLAEGSLALWHFTVGCKSGYQFSGTLLTHGYRNLEITLLKYSSELVSSVSDVTSISNSFIPYNIKL